MVEVDAALLERIAAQRRFEARTLEIAMRLFIHGETPKRLAVEYGVNLQRVYAIRREVMGAAQSVALPPGWAQVTIAGPKELIEDLQRQLAQGLARLGLEDAGDVAGNAVKP